jgi:hypothetical protein
MVTPLKNAANLKNAAKLGVKLNLVTLQNGRATKYNPNNNTESTQKQAAFVIT